MSGPRILCGVIAASDIAAALILAVVGVNVVDNLSPAPGEDQIKIVSGFFLATAVIAGLAGILLAVQAEPRCYRVGRWTHFLAAAVVIAGAGWLLYDATIGAPGGTQEAASTARGSAILCGLLLIPAGIWVGCAIILHRRAVHDEAADSTG